MACTKGLHLALASLCLLLLSDVTVAQTPAVSCQNATPLTVNGTLLLGTWYEAARKPVGGGNNTEECVQMIINYDTNNVTVQVTYSVDPTALWINQTITNTVIYNASDSGANPEIFSAVFNVSSGGVLTTFKILDTDYNSFALICGYVPADDVAATTTAAPSTTTVSSSSTTTGSSTTASSSSTAASTSTSAPVNLSPAGAFIITRERQINATFLATLTSNALVSFSDFQNISTVTQSAECYESGAGTTVPVLAMVLALVYSLLKFVH